MITGREANILRCLPPEEREKLEASSREASRKYIAKSEKLEQQLFSSYLDRERALGRLYPINSRMDKPSTIEPGHPDYTIWIKGWQPILIEMKVDGGELSPEQRSVIAELEALEHGVYLAWNHLQAENIVQFYLSAAALTAEQNDNTRTECPGQARIGQTGT